MKKDFDGRFDKVSIVEEVKLVRLQAIWCGKTRKRIRRTYS